MTVAGQDRAGDDHFLDLVDPKDIKLFLYTTSETCYAVSKVVRANADSIIEELVMKGYSDLTQFESEQDE